MAPVFTHMYTAV